MEPRASNKLARHLTSALSLSPENLVLNQQILPAVHSCLNAAFLVYNSLYDLART
jgi:hypothetical protein